jgi:glucokinase
MDDYRECGMNAIGIDIGGTKIASGLVTSTGEVLDFRSAPTPLTGAEAILDTVIRLSRELLNTTVQGIGIGTAGQVDHVRGYITYANENLPGWTGTPVAERVSAALDLPVWVENDVKAMAIGESRFGAGQNFQHILYLAVGTGIGGAIVLNADIWHGANGTAGEFGYIFAGWDGHRPVKVEEILSGPGLAAHYSERTGQRLSLNQIAQRAAEGDVVAAEVIRDGAHRLGVIVRPILTFLDPQVLIVGGGVIGIGAMWWDSFVESLRDTPIPALQELPLRPAQLGNHAALIGAASIVFNNQSPLG